MKHVRSLYIAWREGLRYDIQRLLCPLADEGPGDDGNPVAGFGWVLRPYEEVQ